MSLSADLRILWQLAQRPKGQTHVERLESFYSRQAVGYDAFRERLLPSRGELYRSIASSISGQEKPGGAWLDLGGGTGANIEHLEGSLQLFESVQIVDLCTPLLSVAAQRITRRGWKNVHVVNADVTTYEPPQGQVDVVTFSYSLTMIPNWYAAIRHAAELLRPGGVLGVVDFYVSSRHPEAGMRRHGWWTRTFWPWWFAFDHVHVGPNQLAALVQSFERIRLDERYGVVPYVPLGRVPHFLYIGRRL